MTQPDTRPTPPRGMPAIRAALAQLSGGPDDIGPLREIVAELVVVQDQQAGEISSQAGEIASLKSTMTAVQDQQRILVESEAARSKAVIGLRKAFAKNVLRMRQIAKDQGLLLKAITSPPPQVLRAIVIAVTVGTIIATLLAKACS